MNQALFKYTFFLSSTILSLNLYSCSSCSEDKASKNQPNETIDKESTTDKESNKSIYDDDAIEDSLIICYGKEDDNEDGEYKYVDLDLPSGISWATCNVGANKPEEYGTLFAWGETKPKDRYSADTYQWYDENESLSEKYTPDTEYYMFYGDDKVYESEAEARGAFVNAQANAYEEARRHTYLKDEDDAASDNWGHNWRMPTYDEMKELMNECDWSWTSNYNESGVSGSIACSKRNGKKIFFPAAGCIEDTTIKGKNETGHYLAITLSGGIDLDSAGVNFSNVSERFGQSVRPVKYRKHKIKTYIKTDVDSYHRSARRIISEIENAENVNTKASEFISSDAKLHDIRGTVKKVVELKIETDSAFNYNLEKFNFCLCSEYCVFSDATLNIFSFDKTGKAVYTKLYDMSDNSNTIECIALRNDKGQLLSFETDENYMGCGTFISFAYNKTGMLDSMYYYGMYGESSKYKYDNEQNLISSYSHLRGSSNVDIKDSKRYKVIKRDKYGNWIKRHILIDRIDSEGEYSEKMRKYELEYRKIQYAE